VYQFELMGDAVTLSLSKGACAGMFRQAQHDSLARANAKCFKLMHYFIVTALGLRIRMVYLCRAFPDGKTRFKTPSVGRSQNHQFLQLNG
jgi:hypothetical protein